MSGHKPTDFDFSGCTLDSGRYQLLNVIASGGFGRVYRAVDTVLPGFPKVAIKCVAEPEPGSLREEFLLREMRLHSKVSSHPNIVTFRRRFKSAAKSAGKPWIWMVLDFCDGGDLITPMAAGRFYNNDVLVKTTMVQLIDALQYCHKQNVQHQDLTIANILLGLDNHVYLADFGLASETAISKYTGCGSTEYLSPEAHGTETKSRPFSTVHSDIWSVGIILVNLLTGRCPWRMAARTDVQFASFIKDPEFLYKTLSISKGVFDILRPVFAMNPLARTSLPELRKQILAVDTFWKTDVDPKTSVQPRINLGSTTITPTKEIQVPARRIRFLKRVVKTITR
ncbi:kinase-like domain-containing protein [Mycena floridula]|nr:kinase-like domain-containing protein [Mycena floridula]